MIAVDDSIFKGFMIYFRRHILNNQDFFMEMVKNIQTELAISPDQISIYMQPAIDMVDYYNYYYHTPVFRIDNSRLQETEVIQRIAKAVSLSINNNIKEILTIIDNENQSLSILETDLYKDITMRLSDNIIQSSRLFMVHKFNLQDTDTSIVIF